MPSIDVYYKHGFMEVPVADAIKRAVRLYGVEYFRAADITLEEASFSFKFHRPEKFDELTNDIIVRVLTDVLTLRRDVSDHACELTGMIVLEEAMPLNAFIGVELTYGSQVGWWAERVRRPARGFAHVD